MSNLSEHHIPDSGLKLVPKPKTRGKLVTIEGAAEVPFAPWNVSDEAKMNTLGREAWSDLGVNCRLALAVMHRTREQLIEANAKFSIDETENLLFAFHESAERLKLIAQMLEGAGARMFAAASAYAVGDET